MPPQALQRFKNASIAIVFASLLFPDRVLADHYLFEPAHDTYIFGAGKCAGVGSRTMDQPFHEEKELAAAFKHSATMRHLFSSLLALGAAQAEAGVMQCPGRAGFQEKLSQAYKDTDALYREEARRFISTISASSNPVLKSWYAELTKDMRKPPTREELARARGKAFAPKSAESSITAYIQAYGANEANLHDPHGVYAQEEKKDLASGIISSHELVIVSRSLETLMELLTDIVSGDECIRRHKDFVRAITDQAAGELPGIWATVRTLDDIARQAKNGTLKKSASVMADSAWAMHERLATLTMQAAEAAGIPTDKYDVFPRDLDG